MGDGSTPHYTISASRVVSLTSSCLVQFGMTERGEDALIKHNFDWMEFFQDAIPPPPALC